MIGQQRLLERIGEQIDTGSFPKFAIIVGSMGSGKDIVAEKIADMMDAWLYRVEPTMDAVRTALADCYAIQAPTVYWVPEGDRLGTAAKNALLKVTEEPPKWAWFVVCLRNAQNATETLRSRAVQYDIQPYTRDEILACCGEGNDIPEMDLEWVTKICDTPGEVDLLLEYGVPDFVGYVMLYLDNISRVGISNSLKPPAKVAVKRDAEGYDLAMFWKAFSALCLDAANEPTEGGNRASFAKRAAITNKFLRRLGVNGISKQMLFDQWVMQLRGNAINGNG